MLETCQQMLRRDANATPSINEPSEGMDQYWWCRTAGFPSYIQEFLW